MTVISRLVDGMMRHKSTFKGDVFSSSKCRSKQRNADTSVLAV